jgi:hypothetical protein
MFLGNVADFMIKEIHIGKQKLTKHVKLIENKLQESILYLSRQTEMD